MSRTIQFVATDPDPGSNYTPEYRKFFDRLRRARIDRGLSLSEMAELVGLELNLAYEFENLIAPLPFEWLEVWCKVVGVPFDDYLIVYWASEEAYAGAKEREAEQNEAAQNALSSTDTQVPAPELPTVSRGSGFLAPLRAPFGRIANFFRSFFPTP